MKLFDILLVTAATFFLATNMVAVKIGVALIAGKPHSSTSLPPLALILASAVAASFP